MLLPPVITDKTFEENISKWLKVVKAGETACILFCPRMDRHRRINQLLNSPKLLKKHLGPAKNYKFLFLDFDLFPVEDTEDLSDYICSQLNIMSADKKFPKFHGWLSYLQKEKINLALLVLNGEKLFRKPYQPIFLFLASITERNPRVQALLFFEGDLSHPDNLKIVSSRTSILQNIIYYPLYKSKDIKQFVYYLSRKWNLKIPQKITLQVIKQCGGHFLLVKEAIRYFSAHPKAALNKIFDHEEMLMRLEWICDGFSEIERDLLKKISFGESSFNIREKHSLSYLKKIGILNQRGKITTPLLTRYLQKAKDKGSQMVLKNNEILLNKVPIGIFFSRQEYRVLKGLLKKKNNLVVRNEIAKLIWPTDTDKNYSDWAIDQLVKRLRKKLAKLFISPKVLKTMRGKGYLLSFE